MKTRILLVLGLALLLARPGLATGIFSKGCSGTETDSFLVVSGTVLCWEYNSDDDSPGFSVRAGTALICLDPDISNDGADPGGASGQVRYCPYGKPTSSPENVCIPLGVLDGTGGDSTAQTACVRVNGGPGQFYWDNLVPADGSARLTVNGE